MAKPISFHEAQHILQDDQVQFEKTVAGLKSKADFPMMRASGKANGYTTNNKEVPSVTLVVSQKKGRTGAE